MRTILLSAAANFVSMSAGDPRSAANDNTPKHVRARRAGTASVSLGPRSRGTGWRYGGTIAAPDTDSFLQWIRRIWTPSTTASKAARQSPESAAHRGPARTSTGVYRAQVQGKSISSPCKRQASPAAPSLGGTPPWEPTHNDMSTAGTPASVPVSSTEMGRGTGIPASVRDSSTWASCAARSGFSRTNESTENALRTSLWRPA